MSESKICPILTLKEGFSGGQPCIEEKCGWYGEGRCAMVEIADNIAIFSPS